MSLLGGVNDVVHPLAMLTASLQSAHWSLQRAYTDIGLAILVEASHERAGVAWPDASGSASTRVIFTDSSFASP